jgi:hypothetical protein
MKSEITTITKVRNVVTTTKQDEGVKNWRLQEWQEIPVVGSVDAYDRTVLGVRKEEYQANDMVCQKAWLTGHGLNPSGNGWYSSAFLVGEAILEFSGAVGSLTGSDPATIFAKLRPFFPRPTDVGASNPRGRWTTPAGAQLPPGAFASIEEAAEIFCKNPPEFNWQPTITNEDCWRHEEIRLDRCGGSEAAFRSLPNEANWTPQIKAQLAPYGEFRLYPYWTEAEIGLRNNPDAWLRHQCSDYQDVLRRKAPEPDSPEYLEIRREYVGLTQRYYPFLNRLALRQS